MDDLLGSTPSRRLIFLLLVDISCQSLLSFKWNFMTTNPLQAGLFCGLSLCRMCVHCYKHCELTYATDLLCMDITVFLKSSTTCGSHNLSATTLTMIHNPGEEREIYRCLICRLIIQQSLIMHVDHLWASVLIPICCK